MLGSRGRAERSGSSKHRSAELGPLRVAGGWLRWCRLAPTPGPLRALKPSGPEVLCVGRCLVSDLISADLVSPLSLDNVGRPT